MNKELLHNACKIYSKLFDLYLSDATKMNEYLNNIIIKSNNKNVDFLNNSLLQFKYHDCSKILNDIDNRNYYDAFSYLITVDRNINVNDYLNDYEIGSIYECENVQIYISVSLTNHYYHANESLNKLFKNLIFVKHIAQLEPLKITNYYLRFRPKKLGAKKKLNVIYVPYPCIKDLFTNTEHVRILNSGLFERSKSGETPKDFDELYLSRINKVFGDKRAEMEEYPTVIFGPEIMGDRYIDQKIREFFTNNTQPICIATPSYHKAINNEENKYKNESMIFVNCDGVIRGTPLTKDTPMELSNRSIKEAIYGEGINIVVIHIIDYMRFVFVICKDYISENYEKIFNQLLPDVIIVQCYTNSTNLFDVKIKSYNSKKVYTVIGNACSAVESNQHKTKDIYITSSTNKQSASGFESSKANCFDKCPGYQRCYCFNSLSLDDGYQHIVVETDQDGPHHLD